MSETYGHLKIICGPMFSSKTSELLKSILWARNGQHKDVLVVKPAFDCRYSMTEIITHDGLSVNANAINAWSELEGAAEYAEIIFLDEVQFFIDPLFDDNIVDIVENYLKKGKTIVGNGLDCDWRGKPFHVTASLMAMADEVVKLTSNCSICGRNATKTFKKAGDNKSVELGGSDRYEPRCNVHWLTETDFTSE